MNSPVLNEYERGLGHVEHQGLGQDLERNRIGCSSVHFVTKVPDTIQWLIPGVLPVGGVVFLSGRPGDMKTWAALSMARAVAAGEPWLGKPTTQGPVLYLDGEMEPGVLGNCLRWAKPIESLFVANWTDPDFPNGLGSDTLREAAKYYRLIVVDTLRRQMDTLKENSSDDMAQITKDLRELTRHGATVLVLHHVPKNPENKGPRGAIELVAGCDISILVTKKPKKAGGTLALEMHKTRYSASTDLTVQFTKGELGPVFTQGDQQSGEDLGAGNEAGDALGKLAVLVETLRHQLGRNPNKTEVKKQAWAAKLGGRQVVDLLLDEGDGVHWVLTKDGKHVRICPLGPRAELDDADGLSSKRVDSISIVGAVPP